MGYNALPSLMTGGPDTSGFVQNALAVKGYQDNKAHQQNVLTQDKEKQTRAAYASAFTNALRATDQEQAKSIWAGTLQSHGLPVNPEEMPEFAITPQGSTITFKDGTVIQGRGDAVAALAQAWGQDPSILQNPAVMSRFAELGGSISLPQDPKPATPGAYKTYVTPDNKIVNIPNNQEPPPGSVPYSAGEDLQIFGPDGQPLMRQRRGGRIDGDDQKQIGTIPPGFKAIYDEKGNVTGMEAIPGGPAAIDAAEAAKKEAAGKAVVGTAAQTVYEDVDRSLDLVDQYGSTAAGIGGMTDWLPTAPAHRLKQHIESVKGNIGIDQLLKIKESGAGLGHIPQAQLEMLASLLGRLDTKMQPEDLKYNLMRIQEIYADIVQRTGGDPRAQYRERKERFQMGRNPVEMDDNELLKQLGR